MLMLIPRLYAMNHKPTNISIHLMLMLISLLLSSLSLFLHFNTSHVNVNRITDIENPIAIYISIHLMLMLIQRI